MIKIGRRPLHERLEALSEMIDEDDDFHDVAEVVGAFLENCTEEEREVIGEALDLSEQERKEKFQRRQLDVDEGLSEGERRTLKAVNVLENEEWTVTAPNVSFVTGMEIDRCMFHLQELAKIGLINEEGEFGAKDGDVGW